MFIRLAGTVPEFGIIFLKKYKHRPIVFQTGGENLIHLPPLIKYPMYDEDSKTQVRNMRNILVMHEFSIKFPHSSPALSVPHGGHGGIDDYPARRLSPGKVKYFFLEKTKKNTP